MLEKLNVYQKLGAIQVKLNAPKNQYNKFGNYNYRSCEDILEGLKPLLKEYNASVIVTDEIVILGDRTTATVFYDKETKQVSVSNMYVKATATFIDNESGEKVSTSAYARHSDAKKGMDDAQVTGATSSYARKYALNGLFCIDDNKDPDDPAYSGNGKSSSKQPSKESSKASAKKPMAQAEFIDEDNPF